MISLQDAGPQIAEAQSRRKLPSRLPYLYIVQALYQSQIPDGISMELTNLLILILHVSYNNS